MLTRPLRLLIFPVLLPVTLLAQTQTERQYLSGHGPKNAVPWEFSVTEGRRAGEWTTIPVPSNWELQGFGTYNYGMEPRKANEHGLYRLRFQAPETWKDRRIRLVFDGVMTDAAVKVNGVPAGPTHRGGFTQFRYDVTPIVKLGQENLLEVDVAKVSSNVATEQAERGGDYWVFGGIFRPVWIEISPAQTIDQVALDARADGTITADVTLGSLRIPRQQGPVLPERIEAQVLDTLGKPFGAPFAAKIPAGGSGRLRLSSQLESPRLWTAETPALYTLRLSWLRGEELVHTVNQRFGFRTFEMRDGQGLYLNGQRILLKGVNRHSFRPETGRALTTEDCQADARLIKELNMNAVRMSHYPPDVAFLDACDELGLYVLNEFPGWHKPHDTANGRLLLREFIERDVNHPSILFWDNGNEGGWNRDLDGDFALYDPQQRRVLHPWEVFGGMDANHYPTYDEHIRHLAGPNLVMPTEFSHAMYDGGGGAALEDYWDATVGSPFGAGGFIWDFADEGVVRTDQNGRVDVFSTYAADGLVGPHGEKEGSFYTVRDLWSPVQIAPPTLGGNFDGTLSVKNHYAFNSLAQCRFDWGLVRFPAPGDRTSAAKLVSQGSAEPPLIGPGKEGVLALKLPSDWAEADALTLTAFSPAGESHWTWTWPAPGLAKQRVSTSSTSTVEPGVVTTDGHLQLVAGDLTATFDAMTGLLRDVRRGEKSLPLTNGPRLTFARPQGEVVWLPPASEDLAGGMLRFGSPKSANTLNIELDFAGKQLWAGFKLEISPDGQTWKTLFDSSRRPGDGKDYEFPPQLVMAVRVTNIHGYDGQPMSIKTLRLGYAPTKFPTETKTTITSGTESHAAWIESSDPAGLSHRWTLRSDGSLQLDYRYTLEGEFAYHGVTFDLPEEQIDGVRWLGEGPSRVWQNRLRGTTLGVYQSKWNNPQPGEDFTYPESSGFFAGVRRAEIETKSGALTLQNHSSGTFLRLGTPRICHGNTSVAFPAGDLSIMHAIPPIGSKFISPEKLGPASRLARAAGEYTGSMTFQIAAPEPK